MEQKGHNINFIYYKDHIRVSVYTKNKSKRCQTEDKKGVTKEVIQEVIKGRVRGMVGNSTTIKVKSITGDRKVKGVRGLNEG